MAVQRVSPEESDSDSESGFSVKDGYLWTMDDPPYSDPVVVHHEAEVVHHDAEKETHWFVSASVEYKRYGGGQPTVSGLTADLGEVDAGKNRPRTVEGLSGQGVTARFTYGAWSVSFPEGGSFYYVGGSLSSGSYAFSGGGDFQYDGTLSVAVESREVVLVPAWDEVESDSWDELVAPPATGKISYLGDYAGSGGAAPSNFSDPPPESGLSASSLRGEAVAYLASGYSRMFRGAGDVGAVWGGLDYAPELFSCGIGRSARLDAYRAGLLGYLCSARAPAAPPVPAPSGAGAAFMVSGSVGESHASAGPWPTAVSPALPGWGRRHSVASSPEEAAARGWLFPDESDSESESGSASPHPAFALPMAGSPAEALCMASFMASASEPQRVPGPDPAFGYALPDPPPGAEPPRLSASAVSAAFSRPPDDPAAMTRCWLVDASAAFDPATSPAFRYTAAAGRGWNTMTDAASQDAWSAFFDFCDGKSLVWSHSTDEATYTPSQDVAFRCWLAASGSGSGNVLVGRAWSTVRVSTTSAPSGEGGDWLVRASADDPDRDYAAWLAATACGVFLAAPVNTEPSDSPPYWRYAYVGSESSDSDGPAGFGLFDVAYAGTRSGESDSDSDSAPSVPRTYGPLAMCSAVPRASADDVAVQPVFTADVTLRETIVGDAVSSGAVVGEDSDSDSGSGSGPSWGGSAGVYRVRRWVVSGLVPGYGRWTREAGEDGGRFDGPSGTVFSSYADLAGFVESAVLPAAGIDPGGLLAGSASWSLETPPGNSSSLVEVDGDGNRGASYPYVETAYSGDLVTEALLTVDVRLSAGCIFESGYCA